MSGRLLRGYGPLLGLAALILAMAVFVPTVGRVVEYRDAGALKGTRAATSGSGADAAAAAASATGAGGGNSAAATAAAQQKTCPDRPKQVPGDPYSPPCYVWDGGDNGGAAYRGVTADKVVVAARVNNNPGFQEAIQQAAGAEIGDRPEDVRRTVSALAEYFNKHFQFYGRKLDVRFFEGKGKEVDEVLGGGQEAAEADAVKVAEEVKAFAELNGNTPPYADALARRKVVSVGVPYMSREWLTERRPYAWSQFTDCSIIVETVAEYFNKKLAKRPAAFAGQGMAGQPRLFGVVAPENSWYQECVAVGRKIVNNAGNAVAVDEKYKLSLGLMSNQATNIVAKLKSSKVTSVVCGCDPVLLVFLTQKAREQDYWPEWIVTGVAFGDQDLVGQLFDQKQWAHAFGVSYAGQPQPVRASLGYNAYKTVRKDEPAFAVDVIYYQMYLVALGVQMAGPKLTPETFEAGMFAYPGGSGPAGTWKFGAGHYTPTQDAREICWDPNLTSRQNSKKGAYVEGEPAKRYQASQWPSDPPKGCGR